MITFKHKNKEYKMTSKEAIDILFATGKNDFKSSTKAPERLSEEILTCKNLDYDYLNYKFNEVNDYNKIVIARHCFNELNETNKNKIVYYIRLGNLSYIEDRFKVDLIKKIGVWNYNKYSYLYDYVTNVEVTKIKTKFTEEQLEVLKWAFELYQNINYGKYIEFMTYFNLNVKKISYYNLMLLCDSQYKYLLNNLMKKMNISQRYKIYEFAIKDNETIRKFIKFANSYGYGEFANFLKLKKL